MLLLKAKYISALYVSGPVGLALLWSNAVNELSVTQITLLA